jgi:hypothetical protein
MDPNFGHDIQNVLSAKDPSTPQPTALSIVARNDYDAIYRERHQSLHLNEACLHDRKERKNTTGIQTNRIFYHINSLNSLNSPLTTLVCDNHNAVEYI